MKHRDLSQLTPYAGEVFTQSQGEKRTYKGVCNGPSSIVVDDILYGYCGGGDFHFEVIAVRDDTTVCFQGAKGTHLSLFAAPAASLVEGSAEKSWTRDEPRPAVNPQLAALQHSIKALEQRLHFSEAERTAAALEARQKYKEVETASQSDETPLEGVTPTEDASTPVEATTDAPTDK